MLESDMDFEKKAKRIKRKIDGAEKVLLSLHRGPDGDSIGSSLAMKHYLESQGKEVKLISPSPFPHAYDYIPADEIEQTQFMDLDLGDFDLFIFMDSASWHMVNEDIDDDTPLPEKEKVINIDHHGTNTEYGGINLVEKRSSTAEIIYDLFKEWEYDLDSQVAQYLLVGVVTDTGVFRYTNTTPSTLKTAAKLMEQGADLNVIVFNYSRRNKVDKLRFWGVVLENLEVDEEHQFAYSFVPYDQAKEYFDDNYPREYKSGAASVFMAGIEDTDFGIVMVEENKGELSGSLRSREDFDVSLIAEELDGGGHPGAAGFSLKLPYLEAAKKVIAAARKHSRK